MEQQVLKLKADFTELKRDGKALNPLYSISVGDNPLELSHSLVQPLWWSHQCCRCALWNPCLLTLTPQQTHCWLCCMPVLPQDSVLTTELAG